MKLTKPALAIIASLSLATLSHAVSAQTAPVTPRVDQREANQSARIDQGVASGQLTQAEAARMRQGQAHVQNVEDRAKADGTVTGKERARIAHAQDVQSARIARQKHDGQRDLNHDGKRDRPSR